MTLPAGMEHSPSQHCSCFLPAAHNKQVSRSHVSRGSLVVSAGFPAVGGKLFNITAGRHVRDVVMEIASPSCWQARTLTFSQSLEIQCQSEVATQHVFRLWSLDTAVSPCSLLCHLPTQPPESPPSCELCPSACQRTVHPRTTRMASSRASADL